MKTDSGRSTSTWMATEEMPPQSPLEKDAKADVCIVGAGIAGISVAYHLARAGKSVIVLDDGIIGGGETSHTTAHLSNAIDDRIYEMESLHGEKGARLAVESHSAAIERIQSIVKEEQIECEFERLDGYLFLGPGGGKGELMRELEAAHNAGLAAVELIGRAPLPSFDTGLCLRFPEQGQFHPWKYLAGLTEAIKKYGGAIYTGTHAKRMQGGTPAIVEAANGRTVTAGAVVVATNTPVNDLVTIHTKQAPYRTYVIGARVRRGSIPRALYWETGWPYHYIRLQDIGAHDHEILLVGGEDHKTAQEDDGLARHGRLEAWTRERFPKIEGIEFRWSGQVMETIDGLAYIGQNPLDARNVYIATGDSGQGMTHGTIAGMLISDLILGRSNEWSAIYDPSRRTLRAAKDFAAENLNVAAQYTGWVTGGEVDSEEQIAPDSGAVVRHGLKKIAVYRDKSGTMHRFSAICVHLGCVVSWNATEKTWDCPCHGSRYTAFGQVVNGPANAGLEELKESTEEEQLHGH
jgi:glycine/D-amino acid oxidase-like deaminating enzyme/nitrite reductase/ring-hydroxylating ferredoxin subunit